MALCGTCLGIGVISNSWVYSDITSAIMITSLVSAMLVVIYFRYEYVLSVREHVRIRKRNSLASAASEFMHKGLYVLGAEAYLACEIIGNCVLSNETFDEEKCDKYARATCIVGFQIFFFLTADNGAEPDSLIRESEIKILFPFYGNRP